MSRMSLFNFDSIPLNVHGDVTIYGAGYNCLELLVTLSRSGKIEKLNIQCIVDSDVKKQGGAIFGIPIVPVESLLSLDVDSPVIITPYEHSLEIGNFLEKKGFKSLYYASPHRADQALTRRIIDEQYLSERDNWDCIKRENAQKIDGVRERLHDEESVEIFDAFLASRFECNHSKLENGSLSREYYPEGVITLGSGEVFVDCGVFDGRSILDFIDHCKDYQHIYAFEPDPMQYELSKTFLNSLKIERCELSNCGVYSEKGAIEFYSTFGGGSGIVKDQTTFSNKFTTEKIVINTETLDHLIYGNVYRPTYIKMDIEGAELEALKGAKNILCRDLPKLAICVYHKPTDIWEIPCWVIENFPQYTLYLRQHELYTDIVMYAVAK